MKIHLIEQFVVNLIPRSQLKVLPFLTEESKKNNVEILGRIIFELLLKIEKERNHLNNEERPNSPSKLLELLKFPKNSNGRDIFLTR